MAARRLLLLGATKAERLRRARVERVRRACERPSVRAELLAMATKHFDAKFDAVWPAIRRRSRMDREAARVAFLAGVVACRDWQEHPPADFRRLYRRLLGRRRA